MPESKWYPHVTIAAVIERENSFLIVAEPSLGKQVFNQSAGHVEQSESLEAVVIRKVLEETGFEFTSTALAGFYHFKTANGTTYLRFNFKGKLGGAIHDGSINPAISAIHWLTQAELKDKNLRNAIVMLCIQDYLNGHALGLEHLPSFEL